MDRELILEGERDGMGPHEHADVGVGGQRSGVAAALMTYTQSAIPGSASELIPCNTDESMDKMMNIWI